MAVTLFEPHRNIRSIKHSTCRSSGNSNDSSNNSSISIRISSSGSRIGGNIVITFEPSRVNRSACRAECLGQVAVLNRRVAMTLALVNDPSVLTTCCRRGHNLCSSEGTRVKMGTPIHPHSSGGPVCSAHHFNIFTFSWCSSSKNLVRESLCLICDVSDSSCLKATTMSLLTAVYNVAMTDDVTRSIGSNWVNVSHALAVRVAAQ
ncbi:hypothetical protein PoB_006976500 [Plakobranchus ocellatus]|uniref:Uncharacterized protein n=1 Tax=Plakobranchus ocellatus TaxID=259542 RepID=A0AAV4DGU9_9GAST|nr:hypothetical protein PoB_006976500 [Plakobranchus ocellatus]